MGLSITILESAHLGVTINEPFNVSLVPTAPATIDINVGVPGASATITVGTTTTLDPGLNATVTNVGTATNAIFDFGIPRGEQGIQGPKGDTGDSGVVYATTPLSYNAGTKTISIDLSAYATQSFVTSQGYITISALTPYITSATAAATYYPLSNPEGYITAYDLAGYATESWVISQNYLTSADLDGYATQSWVTSQGYLTDAASDGYGYVRKDGAWSYSPKFYQVEVGSQTTLTSGQYLINDGFFATNITAGDIELTNAGGGFIKLGLAGIQFTAGGDLQTVPFLPADYYDKTSADARFYPLTLNPAGYITSAALSGYATQSWVTSQGYITSSALSPYLLSSTAASTYQTLSGMSSYAPLSSPTFTGDPKAPTPATGDNDTSIATTAFVKAQGYLTTSAAASTYYLKSNPDGFITSASLAGYALLAGTSNFQVTSGTIKSMASDDNFVQLNETRLEFGTGVTPSGLSVSGTGITFADSTVQTTAAVAGIPDAPMDSQTYGRNNGAWTVVSGGGSFNGGAVANPITIAGTTYDSEMASDYFGVELSSDHSKFSLLSYNSLQVADGSASASVSPTNVSIVDGVNGTTNIISGSVDFVGATSSDEISISANEQTITLYTSGSTLSVTPTGITFPDSSVQSVAFPGLTTYAPIAAAVPTGGSTGQVLTKTSGTNYALSWTTPAVGDKYYTTSTTSLSVANGNKSLTVGTGLSYTTQQSVIVAYDAAHHMHGVVTSYNSSTGAMVVDVSQHTGTGTYTSWTVNVGGVVAGSWGSITGTLSDQTDLQSALDAKLAVTTAASTYAPLTSPSLTGTPLSTTATADTNTTQIATTAYVVGQASATTPVVNGTATIGTSLKYARADHIHPIDTSRAALASPTFTGTPSAPTATVGTNTTQIATTAFVLANAGSGGGGCNVQTFGSSSSSGAFTWTKPAGAKIVEIWIWGGGSGGGAGARQATTSIRGGGGGGAAGVLVRTVLYAGSLGSTETVSIGSGAAGSPAISTDNTNGGTANQGGASTFGSIIRTNGGNQPGGGSTVGGGSGGSGQSSLFFTASTTAGAGGAGATTTATSGTNNTIPYINTALGGGGGGGAAAASTAMAGGGSGGGHISSSASGSSVTIAGGTAGNPTTPTAATAGTSASTQYLQGGTGGGGGYYKTATAGGTGGAGGWPGGGGGGGGASDNGFASGTGGAGANGFAVIITYF